MGRGSSLAGAPIPLLPSSGSVCARINLPRLRCCDSVGELRDSFCCLLLLLSADPGDLDLFLLMFDPGDLDLFRLLLDPGDLDLSRLPGNPGVLDRSRLLGGVSSKLAMSGSRLARSSLGTVIVACERF